MSRKRRNTSSPEADSPPAPKRHYTDYGALEWDSSDEDESKEKPQFNEHTGQAGAFPGLGNDGDELFYGPASDGLDYLRMVRSEAKSVPHILTASSTQSKVQEQQEVSKHENKGGFYSDGTYTALAGTSEDLDEAWPDAQEYYYDSLLKQFRVVQATMRCTPPLAVIERLASSKLISLPEDSRKARHQWEALITAAGPHPAQIAAMDPQSVLELVKLLRTRLIRLLGSKDKSIVSRIGGWLWAVLGRCRDRGELSSEEISELRQLAQRAIYLQSRVNIDSEQHAPNDDTESLDVGYDDGDSQDGQVRSGITPPADEASNLSSGEDREDDSVEEEVGKAVDRDKLVAVTLDMVITVVGEVYGQRDLLESRRKWEQRKIPT